MEEFTSPEPEVQEELTPELTDLLTDGSVPEEATTETEAYMLTVSDYSTIMVSSISWGALLGAIFMIVGLSILGIVKIFKKA